MTKTLLSVHPVIWIWGIRFTRFYFTLSILIACSHALESTAVETPAGKPFVWRLGDGSGASYLMGSIHVARPEVYPLPSVVEDAFSACDDLVVEANPESIGPEQMNALILRRSVDLSGRTLADKISKDAHDALLKLLKKHKVDVGVVDRLKPWYVSQLISVLELKRLGVDPLLGIDLHFIKKASGTKPVVELEGIEKQLEFFDSLTEAEQVLMLQYTLHDLEHLEEVIDEIIVAWKSGQPGRLDGLLNQWLDDSTGTGKVYQKLFTDRNNQMVSKIQAYLQDGKRHFIVVGAGHLIGEGGLLHLLTDDGVRIEQLEPEELVRTEAARK